MNRVCLAVCLLMFGALSVSRTAAEDGLITVVTASVPVDEIRFAGSPTTAEMRVEVWSPARTLVYDSDWKEGNILDWVPTDNSGQSLPYGPYRLVMRSKNFAGQVSENEAVLHVDNGGMTIDGQPRGSQKIVLTAHDGQSGQVISTAGDLSFRFGDFLRRNDVEVMRLTMDGRLGIGTVKPQASLDVNGLVRTSKGILFADGTVLTSIEGQLKATRIDTGVESQKVHVNATSIRPFDISSQRLSQAGRPIARPTATSPDNQFKVDANGVHIGTTPAFGLDVAGNVTIGTVSSDANALVTLIGSTSATGNSPFIPLSLHSSFATGIDMYSHAAANFRAPQIMLYHSQGTQALPLASLNNDVLGWMFFGGYDGAGYFSGSFLEADASENWTPTAHGTFFSLATTPNGSVSPVTRLTVNNTGEFSVGMGSTLGTYTLDTSGIRPNLTARFYDRTPTSGSTSVQIREGVNQSTNEVFGVYANDGATPRLTIQKGRVSVPNLPIFADNASAIAGGLTAGNLYRTSAGVLMVTY